MGVLPTSYALSLIEFYQPGKRLTLSLGVNCPNIDVFIVKSFTPFTCSVVLLVELDSQNFMTVHLPSRFVVKLADRRIYPDSIRNWTIDAEEDYQSNLLSHISKYGSVDEYYRFRSLHDQEHLYLPWMDFFERWEGHQIRHSTERKAYEHLSEAQSLGLIPRFFGAAMLNMMPSAPHASLTHISALLFEFIPGRPMASLKPGVTIALDKAEAISQRIIQLGRRLRRYGTPAPGDTNNVILRSPDDSPVLIDWACANLDDATLSPRERWEALPSQQDFNKDIRWILAVADHRDSKGLITPPDPDVGDGIWHRHSTPLADQVQFTRAEQFGFYYVNKFIENLPPETLEMLYDEDSTVDYVSGLRWRVKNGVKTRFLDDPFPETEL
ncbi:hypothetical protein H0H93_015095 [Arthromyces matolae]|nr:hypothetical protein H0H93_015095 [Arthromyces matolae]